MLFACSSNPALKKYDEKLTLALNKLKLQL